MLTYRYLQEIAKEKEENLVVYLRSKHNNMNEIHVLFYPWRFMTAKYNQEKELVSLCIGSYIYLKDRSLRSYLWGWLRATKQFMK